MKFLVPNYSCLQKPWLGGYRPHIPVLSVLKWICWTPHPRTNFLGTPLGMRMVLKRILKMYNVWACGMDPTCSGDHIQLNGGLLWRSLLLLALEICRLNNSPPCISIHSRLTPVLNLHFTQILSDIILPSQSQCTNPYCSWSPLCYSFNRPFFTYFDNMPNPSNSLCSCLSNYSCMSEEQTYFGDEEGYVWFSKFHIGRGIIVRNTSLPHKTSFLVSQSVIPPSRCNNTPRLQWRRVVTERWSKQR